MTKLLLVDGSNYLFRAYHALPPLTTSKGEPTGAIKGFLAMLRTVLEEIKPDYAACVFDAHAPTFRHAIYPEYKSNRPPMPEDLRVQIEPIHELVRLLGWPLLQIEGVEADDVLATLAVRARARGIEVFVATGDKDLAQIVTEGVSLVNTMTHVTLDPAGVREKYGVPPERIIDYLALMGDKVDNVPGIDKCGPKTAAKWIEQYGSLQGVIDAAPTVKGKIGENLRAGLPFIETARKLVTIDTNVQLPVEPEALTIAPVDEAEQNAFFARWEIRARPRAASVVKPVPAGQGSELFAQDAGVASQVGLELDPIVVGDEIGLADLEGTLAEAAGRGWPVAMSLISDPVHFMTDRPAAIALAVSPLKVFAIDLTGKSAVSVERLSQVLSDWLASAAPKIFHDAKYALHMLANCQMTPALPVHDTMLQNYVLASHEKHELERLAAHELHVQIGSEETLLGKGASRLAVRDVDAQRVARHLAARAATILTLWRTQAARLAAQPDLERIYGDIELPVMRVLHSMERTGVGLDVEQLAVQTRELTERIDALMAQIQEVAGEPFNPASPKQLAHVLFEKLQLPVRRKTASGTPSTDEDVLSELALDYPLPKLILEFRRLSKLRSTYTDKLPEMVCPIDSRVHTTFGQAVAVTGRLASSDPNLQNIPVRTAEGRRVREAFVARPGYRIISADYSQIELRIMAHMSRDPGLLKAFRDGMDVHRATAAEVFSVQPDAVSADQRRMAKVINFGLIYGMGAFGLAQNLGVDRASAQRYIEQYFHRYPSVAEYMESTRELARTTGCVHTEFGRRLALPDIRSPRAQVRAGAERAAINAPMQGTAADIIKLAMIAVDEWINKQDLRSRLVLQVHDELILEVPEEEVELVRQTLPRLMEQAATLSVPLLAQVGVAQNWEAAH